MSKLSTCNVDILSKYYNMRFPHLGTKKVYNNPHYAIGEIMKKNARIYTKKSKEGKDYLYLDLENPSKGECFTFALSPKFLNKKQFAYLMRLVVGNNEERK